MHFRISFLGSKIYVGSLLRIVLNLGEIERNIPIDIFAYLLLALLLGMVFVALVNYLENHDFFIN